MIIPVAALVAVVLPALLGGRLALLAGLRLRWSAWVVGALVVQIVIIEIVSGPAWVLESAHVATYVVAAAFLLLNRRIPGLPSVALGTLTNGVAIAANGGTLPARPEAVRLAGLDDAAGGFVNSGVLEHPRLAFLGDVFAVPASLPLANVFSIGDVLIIAGVAVTSLRVCGTRWTAPWSPGRPGSRGR